MNIHEQKGNSIQKFKSLYRKITLETKNNTTITTINENKGWEKTKGNTP